MTPVVGPNGVVVRLPDQVADSLVRADGRDYSIVSEPAATEPETAKPSPRKRAPRKPKPTE